MSGFQVTQGQPCRRVGFIIALTAVKQVTHYLPAVTFGLNNRKAFGRSALRAGLIFATLMFLSWAHYATQVSPVFRRIHCSMLAHFFVLMGDVHQCRHGALQAVSGKLTTCTPAMLQMQMLNSDCLADTMPPRHDGPRRMGPASVDADGVLLFPEHLLRCCVPDAV